MGGKRSKIKHFLKTLFRVRTWKLILILLPLLFLAATLLRLDHLGMVERRDRVKELDESGTVEELTGALDELQKYTGSHIVINMIEENGSERIIFGTGPFYLEQQYARKAQEELAKAEAALLGSDQNPYGNVYKLAAEVCDDLARRYSWGFNTAYVNCMTSELAKYPGIGEIVDQYEAQIPPTSLYRRDFASPVWCWSWAGIVIFLCVALTVVIFIRLVIWLVLRLALILMKKG